MNDILPKIDFCAGSTIRRQGAQRLDATFARSLVSGRDCTTLARFCDIKGDGVDLQLLPAVFGKALAAGDHQIGTETVHGQGGVESRVEVV